MKIVVAGDWHGNLRWARSVVRLARANGIDKIIQVGDFGYWPHKYEGVKYLDYLNKELIDNNVMLYWVDGNHENHAMLRAHLAHTAENHHGHSYIRSEILYSGRGNSWTWDGKRFATVGGAYSVDRLWRTVGESWWPEEQLSEDELNTISLLGRPVDYLFTHDAPTSFPLALKPDPESNIHRQKMNTVAAVYQPKRWFHGHYHTEVTYTHKSSIVHGMDMDGRWGNVGVLYTGADKFLTYTEFKELNDEH